MIYIALVILISSSIFVTFKLFDRYKVDNFQAITINYLVASLFGIFLIGSDFTITDSIKQEWFPYAIYMGILFIATFILFALSSQKAGVAITAVFSKMSVIIPVITGILLFQEQLNLLKILGIVATLLAFILVFYKKENNRIKWLIIFLPLLIFLGNGIIDSSLKYIEYHFISDDYFHFLTWVFITGLFAGSIISLIKYIRNRQTLMIESIIGGTILGLLNYTTTYFMLLAMSRFQSNVLFPIQNVGIVMFSALLGLILFKEKLSMINWIGILLSISAILLIAYA